MQSLLAPVVELVLIGLAGAHLGQMLPPFALHAGRAHPAMVSGRGRLVP